MVKTATTEIKLPKAVVIAGPTASGKTALTHSLYRPGDSLINCDSRQVFKHLNIATAKPSKEEIQKYNWKLLDCVEPEENFSASDFLKKCSQYIKASSGRSIIAGGTPLYVSLLDEGLADHPPVTEESKKLVQDWYKEGGEVLLAEKLKERDPQYWQIVDRQNRRRLFRALEVIESSGQTFSKIRSQRVRPEFEFFRIVIAAPREWLDNCSVKRISIMEQEGLIGEAESLFKKYQGMTTGAFSGIGYRELFEHLQGKISKNEALEKMRYRTRRLIVEQLSWFKKSKSLFLIPENAPYDCLGAEKWLYDKIELPDISFKKLDETGFGNWKLRMNEKGFSRLKNLLEDFYAD